MGASSKWKRPSRSYVLNAETTDIPVAVRVLKEEWLSTTDPTCQRYQRCHSRLGRRRAYPSPPSHLRHWEHAEGWMPPFAVARLCQPFQGVHGNADMMRPPIKGRDPSTIDGYHPDMHTAYESHHVSNCMDTLEWLTWPRHPNRCSDARDIHPSAWQNIPKIVNIGKSWSENQKRCSELKKVLRIEKFA